jgi:hypothetical protein
MVKRFGNKSAVTRILVPDADEQREMVINAFVTQTDEELCKVSAVSARVPRAYWSPKRCEGYRQACRVRPRRRTARGRHIRRPGSRARWCSPTRGGKPRASRVRGRVGSGQDHVEALDPLRTAAAMPAAYRSGPGAPAERSPSGAAAAAGPVSRAGGTWRARTGSPARPPIALGHHHHCGAAAAEPGSSGTSLISDPVTVGERAARGGTRDPLTGIQPAARSPGSQRGGAILGSAPLPAACPAGRSNASGCSNRSVTTTGRRRYPASLAPPVRCPPAGQRAGLPEISPSLNLADHAGVSGLVCSRAPGWSSSWW